MRFTKILFGSLLLLLCLVGIIIGILFIIYAPLNFFLTPEVTHLFYSSYEAPTNKIFLGIGIISLSVFAIVALVKNGLFEDRWREWY